MGYAEFAGTSRVVAVEMVESSSSLPSALPAGVVTFLFSDVQGSTRLWEADAGAMRGALERHDAIIDRAVEASNGVSVKPRGEGDSHFVVFRFASDAAAAALAIQRDLQAESWETAKPLRIRIALHTGEAQIRDADYYGPAVNRCARLRAIGHGGQTLLSQATVDLIAGSLPDGASLTDLGAHRLRDLTEPERVFQLDHPDLPSVFPPLESLDARPNNIPLQLSSFVGRETERGELAALAEIARVVTLTGPGGVGKTRLAYQVAADVADRLANGVWVCELAATSDPDLVPQAVATAMGVREEPGRPLADTLTDYLQPKRALLVLDNCEHVVGACRDLARAILERCPEVRLLSTSREPLSIRGESLYPVPSMPVPPEGNELGPDELAVVDSVRLFVDRATRSKPAFTLTADNASAVTAICRRLDGIPLAIELAAARVRHLAPADIAKRLDDRLRFLAHGGDHAVPRHATLSAAIDWSHEMLTEGEKILFRRLAVFAGSFSLDAVEDVCGEGLDDPQHQGLAGTLDLLSALVDRSLVVAEERQDLTRFRMLETIRAYATQCFAESGEQPAIRERHMDYFLALAERVRLELEGPDPARWMEMLDHEHDNILEAFAGPCGADGRGLRLAAAMWWFWGGRGLFALGRARLADVLTVQSADSASRIEALRGAGILSMALDDYPGAVGHFEQALAFSRQTENWRGVAISLQGLGLIAATEGDYSKARDNLEEALAMFRDAGDRLGAATSLRRLGAEVALAQGDYPGARAYLEEALASSRELGGGNETAWSLCGLGAVGLAERDYPTARACFEETLEMFRETGDSGGIAYALQGLGWIAAGELDCPTARVRLTEALEIFRDIGDQSGIAFALDGFAAVLAAEAAPSAAAQLAGAAARIRDAIGSQLSVPDRAWIEDVLASARAGVGEEAFAHAFSAGRALSLEEAIQLTERQRAESN